MLEFQRRGMEKIPRKSIDTSILSTQHSGRSIESIAHDRMSQRRQVHSDLVSPTGINFQVEQGELAERRINSLLNNIMGDGLAPTLPPDCHFGAMHAITANGATDRPFVVLHPSVHECNVFFLDLALRELRRQAAMGLVIFRNDEESAGGLVETVHDSRTHFSAYTRKLSETV